MKLRIRAALTAAALTAGSMVGLAVAPAAQAGTCTETVGPVMEVVTTGGYDLGTFYQGFDFCQKRAYAEFHFKDLWVSQVADGNSQVWIVSGASNDPGMHTGRPAGATWWDAGSQSVYSTSSEVYQAGFYLSWNGNICQGHSDWYYGSGTPLGAGVGGPSCKTVGNGPT
ncbi:hypothetical protein [Kitasatospora sp. NPDC089509]|uniref:hypothetical protein n=1 Tax=Kitasatospora sp. NPDC089509 TaxID=3364079 RepID=UPI0038194458